MCSLNRCNINARRVYLQQRYLIRITLQEEEEEEQEEEEQEEEKNPIEFKYNTIHFLLESQTTSDHVPQYGMSVALYCG